MWNLSSNARERFIRHLFSCRFIVNQIRSVFRFYRMDATSIVRVSKRNFSKNLQFCFRIVLFFSHSIVSLLFASLIFSLIAWFLCIQLIRLVIKAVFVYKGWMYERAGQASTATKLFMAILLNLNDEKRSN